jgi:hypothetical protein
MRETIPEDQLAQTQRELFEARELQAASAQVLRIISTSPKDVQPVFDAIAESAVRLCKGQFSFVLRFDNDVLRFGASHAGASGEPCRQFGAHRLGRSIEGRIATPAHRAGTMEHLLGAHLEDHIGMGAHPDSARRDLAQQRVKIDAAASLVNRVHPDEHAIECGELCAHRVEDIIFVDYWVRIDADIGKRREDGLESAVLWRGTAARRFVATP